MAKSRRCIVCKKHCKRPFASLKFGHEAADRYCSFECLQNNHINQTIDIIFNCCDMNFVEKMYKILRARAVMLQKEQEIESDVELLPQIAVSC